MNFKPVEQKNSPNSIQKLQDIDYPIIGNFVETTTSKMGSPIYHIRRDYDLIRIYGFKNLDSQMANVSLDQLVRITYQGSKNTTTGGIKHFALVEVCDSVYSNHIAEPANDQSSSKLQSSPQDSNRIGLPEISKEQLRLLEKFGFKKTNKQI